MQDKDELHRCAAHGGVRPDHYCHTGPYAEFESLIDPGLDRAHECTGASITHTQACMNHFRRCFLVTDKDVQGIGARSFQGADVMIALQGMTAFDRRKSRSAIGSMRGQEDG